MVIVELLSLQWPKKSQAKNVYKTRHLKFRKYNKAISGSFVNNGHSMQFNPTDSPIQLLSHGSLPGKNKYQFTQLHFHWGSNNTVGAEHTVDGFRYGLPLNPIITCKFSLLIIWRKPFKKFPFLPKTNTSYFVKLSFSSIFAKLCIVI